MVSMNIKLKLIGIPRYNFTKKPHIIPNATIITDGITENGNIPAHCKSMKINNQNENILYHG